MVQQGAFKVELVDAVLKEPFPEHKRDDGLIFVEAEPKADYYIHYQKNKSFCCPDVKSLRVEFSVDEKDLGFCRAYPDPSKTDCGSYEGPTDFLDGNETITHSLTFDTPNLVRSGETFSVDSFIRNMGKVEVKIFEGAEHGERDSVPALDGGFESLESVTISQEGTETEKFVRSSVGTKKMTEISSPKSVIRAGKLLDTITIRYCSVKGLQLVGVLPCNKTAFGHLQWEQLRRRDRRSQMVTPSPPKKKIRYTEEVQNIGDALVHQVMILNLLEDSDDEKD